ncbi:SPOR domain-containing protein [Salipiger sp. IMCC34102]|uniref:SPOR domain-containing protein n=1 Tax=Salipiger sp. IMCC34102 TaxID=2510647 RepID=UPI00101D9D0F|nr:SPOR domain-containing protein [Salipiger sp. IMCC34102]RYH02421.1 SPOR domain-containing protein [Salipiger sp. IMCC34102]
MRHTKTLLAFSLALTVAGCDQFPRFGEETSAAGGALTPVGDPANSQDVEAPQVFDLTTPGLWDGRPSLGGVWVAHPTVTDPERVLVRNTENGQSVIGALFRRERETPGPALQVSSDAAGELGMLAGDPATLSVVALRREPLDPGAQTAIADFDAPEVITAEPIDDTATAGPAPIAVPTPAPAPAPAVASTLEKPFVQIGIFSLQSNADNTATALRAEGLAARMLEQESQGRTIYRVIVGPAPTEADRAAVLDQVRGLGFTDAYPVTN